MTATGGGESWPGRRGRTAFLFLRDRIGATGCRFMTETAAHPSRLTDYDHFRDIRSGAVAPEGIDLNWLLLGHHECFARMTGAREFDLSEMSFREVRDS